ncbi:hypothetical protein Ddc_03567 [Ditylenchus destructor]|nr:hypothetical protein Ddc_03567 [Ditylenchus destructor]
MKLLLDILLEIYHFLARDELELLLMTSHMTKQMVEQHFITLPYRYLEGTTLHVGTTENELDLYLEKFVHSSHPLATENAMRLKIPSYYHINAKDWIFMERKSYTFAQLSPFLLQPCIRIPTIIITISHSCYTEDDMVMLGTIEHIWQSQQVSIIAPKYLPYENSYNVDTSAKLLLNSQYFNQCYTLLPVNIDPYVPLHKFDVVYNVNVLTLGLIVPLGVVLGLIEKKPLHRDSNLQAIVFNCDKQLPLPQILYVLQREFLAASVRNPFRLLIPHQIKEHFNINEFQLTNSITSEVLELKGIPAEQAAPYVKGAWKCHSSWVTVERSYSVTAQKNCAKRTDD